MLHVGSVCLSVCLSVVCLLVCLVCTVQASRWRALGSKLPSVYTSALLRAVPGISSFGDLVLLLLLLLLSLSLSLSLFCLSVCLSDIPFSTEYLCHDQHYCLD